MEASTGVQPRGETVMRLHRRDHPQKTTFAAWLTLCALRSWAYTRMRSAPPSACPSHAATVGIATPTAMAAVAKASCKS